MMKNKPSVDHDFVGRLTDTDTKMLHKCTKVRSNEIMCRGFYAEKKKNDIWYWYSVSLNILLYSFSIFNFTFSLSLSLSLLIQDLLFTDEIDSNSTISPSPQHENTTFMTDEKMKKILMPKKIEF